MIKKTLLSLTCLALLGSLSACGGSPDETVTPTTTTASLTEASAASETSTTTPSESSGPMPSESAEESPSTEPTESSDPASNGELPTTVHGKWITFSQGETPRECSEELDGEGAIITIDATSIASFAFIFELKELQETTDNSIEALFNYADDSDTPMTPMIRLETTDDWQTLELIELGTEGQAPAMYARCAA